MKILILGGYGVFGGRLAELIQDLPVQVLIAGRSAAKSTAFCKTLFGPASFEPLVLERADIADALQQHKPSLVVDASGPFQDYGDDPYVVIKACLNARVNYLDFADGADLVFGVRELDVAAKAAGIYALSGVSSFPVLTAAVLRKMKKQGEIDSVWGGIAPSPYAGIGMNVMKAVLSYAGAPVKIWRSGQLTQARGLTEIRHAVIAPPGHVPLRRLRFSLVDVPDLQVIPPEHPNMQEIWMGAGPVPTILHRLLNLLARLRANGLLPNLSPLAPFCYRILNLMKFGAHRGGMILNARLKDGSEISWHLLAEGDDGPYIPSMAIEALIRKEMAGTAPAAGARPATQALELSDYDALFEAKDIHTGWRRKEDGLPLYREILGDAFHDLPPQLQALHNVTTPVTWKGDVHVTAAKNPVARWVAKIFGFPTKDRNTSAEVSFKPDETGERWARNFGGHKFSSHQSLGTGPQAHLVIERFGPIAVAMAVQVKNNQLHLVPRSWRLFGLPLPKSLLPAGPMFEAQSDGKFHFNVDIRLPVLGRMVHYHGLLSVVD